MAGTALQNRPDTVMSIPEASHALGFSRSLGYELAALNKFPVRVIRAGSRYIVPRAEVNRALGITPEEQGAKQERTTGK